MPPFFSESAPMPQNRFISWDKAVLAFRCLLWVTLEELVSFR